MEDLIKLSNFYHQGNTLSYNFRLESLKKLQLAILNNEEAIYDALFSDLKKSKEESWSSETGQILEEIKFAIKHLHRWMKPEKVSTGLLSFPSKGRIYKDPLGVVLIIAPWNYPLQLIMVPLVGAIAAGNCVVLKPSESAPATEKLILKIIKETFDEEYVKVVTGDGAEVVNSMMSNFRFDHIFYTGSAHVGKEIYKLAAKDLIPVTMELGGKSPCIVESDAIIKVAARRIVLGKFLNAGQTCIAPDYVLVHSSKKEELLKEVASAIEQFYTGQPQTSYDYGKIINQKRFQTLIGFLEEGNIYFGGKSSEDSLYIEPTIITDVSMENSIMKEEIFGPILPVISFETTEEAMDIVRQNKNPLAFYLFTENKNTETEWLQQIRFGGGCINNCLLHFANKSMPFGGVGYSGFGAYHGKFTFNVFSHCKSVLKSATWPDPGFKYPSFKGKLKWLKKVIG
ncbi:MAG: aldehyde dehydrogenase [Ginsengibacter sp.]